jgi:hypothetical protein
MGLFSETGKQAKRMHKLLCNWHSQRKKISVNLFSTQLHISQQSRKAFVLLSFFFPFYSYFIIQAANLSDALISTVLFNLDSAIWDKGGYIITQVLSLLNLLGAIITLRVIFLGGCLNVWAWQPHSSVGHGRQVGVKILCCKQQGHAWNSSRLTWISVHSIQGFS